VDVVEDDEGDVAAPADEQPGDAEE